MMEIIYGEEMGFGIRMREYQNIRRSEMIRISGDQR